MLAILLATYGAVFLAEIVGDKLLYTTGVLATRYHAVPILLGMALAFMAKMGAAVLLGKAIATLPPLLVAAVTAVNFFAIAFVLWRKPEKQKPIREYPSSRAALVAFSAIFFSEWGDVGMITTATMEARFNAPLAVWLGAVAAMITKGAFAASIGIGLRRWISDRFTPKQIRYAAVALLAVLGILSVFETFEGHEEAAGLLLPLLR
jgi:Ca2+/H+ antiporter, TMEM165/GDT1 family